MKRSRKFNLILFPVLALLAAFFYFMPGLLTSSLLVVWLWCVIYYYVIFDRVSIDDWKFGKNVARLVVTAILTFCLTGGIFYLGTTGASWFWNNPGSNTRHYFLLHEGFVSPRSQGMVLAGDNRSSVLAGLEGNIAIKTVDDKTSLNCLGLPYPLYVAKGKEGGIWQLQQKGLQALLPTQQLTVHFPGDTSSETISIQSERKESNKFDFTISHNGVDTTLTDKVIAYGIRFADLLEKTSFHLSDSMLHALGQLYLLKDSIQFNSKENDGRTLYWYYGKDPTFQYWQTKVPDSTSAMVILTHVAGEINLSDLLYQDCVVDLQDGDRFYFGLEPAAGRQFLSQPAFKVNLTTDSIMVKYLQPQIFSLPDMPGRNNEVFITSHYNNALNRAGYFGYILPALNFENTDTNVNHFWGNLQYQTASPGHELSNIRFKTGITQSVNSDSSWIVSSPGGSAGWIFKLHNSWVDVRKDKMSIIYPMMIVALFSFLMIGLYAFLYRREKHSATPVFIWWLLNILFYFFLLRLFLSWRVRSYPYTEFIGQNEFKDFIDKAAFYKMSLPINFWIAIILCVAFTVFFVTHYFFNAKQSRS